jgi:hypothetical protein
MNKIKINLVILFIKEECSITGRIFALQAKGVGSSPTISKEDIS